MHKTLYLFVWIIKKSKALSALSLRLTKLTGKSKYRIHPKHLIKIEKPWYLSSIKKTDKVLDLGCHNGQHTLKTSQFCKSIKGLDKSLDQLKFNINASYINSELTMNIDEYNRRVLAARDGESIEDTRELQGQSPFLINTGLNYTNSDKGLQTGLFFNVQGKTLEVVGTGIVPDVYTKPFSSLNFTLNKSFGQDKKSTVDVKVSNILNSKRESVYESYGTTSKIFSSFQPGTEVSVGYSYKF